MAYLGKLLTLVVLPVFTQGMQSVTCPSSSLYVGMSKDAAGDTVFATHPLPTPGECQNVVADIPAGAQFKLCGPGTWSISRMSCDTHNHKAVVIEHPTDAFTISTCKVYNFADYPAINGFVGSAIFTCSATVPQKTAPTPSSATTPVSGTGMKCTVTQGLNRGVTDADCARCELGYQWWPCNEEILCTCVPGAAAGRRTPTEKHRFLGLFQRGYDVQLAAWKASAGSEL